MASVFWTSRQRNRLLIMAAALIAVVGATAYAQVKLNAWNRPFYNALTRKDVAAFVEQIGVFAVLAVILLVLNVAQTWLNQRSKIVLREGLVNNLLNEWLSPRRAFRLSNSGAMGANPDQRLQADAQHLTDLTTELGIGLLQSTLLLLLFIGVLWGLSRGMFLPFAGHQFAPPGYMVWCALLYAGAASYLSWRVGRPLIALDADHYAREAELRRNRHLLGDVRRLQAEHRGRYGSPRMHAALRAEGRTASRGRVARLMRHHGIRGLAGRRFKPCTTDSRHDLPIAPNLLKQVFAATAPNTSGWRTSHTSPLERDGSISLRSSTLPRARSSAGRCAIICAPSCRSPRDDGRATSTPSGRAHPTFGSWSEYAAEI